MFLLHEPIVESSWKVQCIPANKVHLKASLLFLKYQFGNWSLVFSVPACSKCSWVPPSYDPPLRTITEAGWCPISTLWIFSSISRAMSILFIILTVHIFSTVYRVPICLWTFFTYLPPLKWLLCSCCSNFTQSSYQCFSNKHKD